MADQCYGFTCSSCVFCSMIGTPQSTVPYYENSVSHIDRPFITFKRCCATVRSILRPENIFGETVKIGIFLGNMIYSFRAADSLALCRELSGSESVSSKPSRSIKA